MPALIFTGGFYMFKLIFTRIPVRLAIGHFGKSDAPPRTVAVSHRFGKHFYIEENRNVFYFLLPQKLFQFFFGTYRPRARAVTAGNGGIVDIQKLAAQFAVRRAVAQFGTQGFVSLPRLQIVYAAEACVVEKAEVNFLCSCTAVNNSECSITKLPSPTIEYTSLSGSANLIPKAPDTS